MNPCLVCCHCGCSGKHLLCGNHVLSGGRCIHWWRVPICSFPSTPFSGHWVPLHLVYYHGNLEHFFDADHCSVLFSNVVIAEVVERRFLFLASFLPCVVSFGGIALVPGGGTTIMSTRMSRALMVICRGSGNVVVILENKGCRDSGKQALTKSSDVNN